MKRGFKLTTKEGQDVCIEAFCNRAKIGAGLEFTKHYCAPRSDGRVIITKSCGVRETVSLSQLNVPAGVLNAIPA